MSAALFSASLLHVPVAGASVHLGLYGLAGILLGRRAFTAVAIALLFQALLFQHGGVLALGVNALNMGLGAIAAAIIWRSERIPESLRAPLAGGLGAGLPALALAAELSLAGHGWGGATFGALGLAGAAIEAILTVSVVSLMRRVDATLLEGA